MPSAPQTFQNHMRLRPGFHYVTSPVILTALVWAVVQLVRAPSSEHALMLLVVVALSLVAFWSRTFPLGVQDRLIRLEERLRMERLLPDDLRRRADALSPGQLIALRFASDAELPELVRRVLDEQITDRKEIKSIVKEWRADHFRI